MIRRLKIIVHRFFRYLIFNFPIKSNRPSFLIIGSQKAGTTTLFRFLDQHPCLHGALKKEIHFFNSDVHYARGYSWYEAHFKNLNLFRKKPLFFEATPEYIISDVYLRRILNYDRHLKVIVILREPVSRAYSAWNFFSKMPRYKDLLPSFEECINRELQVYEGKRREDWVTAFQFVRRGIYSDQLMKCFQIFGREKVLVIGSAEFANFPVGTLNRVLSFLEMPQNDWKFLKWKHRNVGVYTKKFDDRLKAQLEMFFDPYNKKLANLLGFIPEW
jgi:hypothetical protein